MTFLQHFCSLHTGRLLWQAGLTFIHDSSLVTIDFYLTIINSANIRLLLKLIHFKCNTNIAIKILLARFKSLVGTSILGSSQAG